MLAPAHLLLTPDQLHCESSSWAGGTVLGASLRPLLILRRPQHSTDAGAWAGSWLQSPSAYCLAEGLCPMCPGVWSRGWNLPSSQPALQSEGSPHPVCPSGVPTLPVPLPACLVIAVVHRWVTGMGLQPAGP